MSTTLVGHWGESIAAEFLRKNGYQLRSMNYHSRFGEIDIIASKKNVLAFVEVKLRKDKSYGEAREFVTKIKQSKIKLTAESYIASSSTALQPRFDVIEIYAPNGISKNYTINHIENAFE